jgi:hypothetical protein
MNRATYRAFLPTLLIMALAPASMPPSTAQHMIVVPAEEASKATYVTNKGINWYTSLDQARAEAKKEGKLVFWLHMLGTIDGAT